jgi:hypothetical protein
LTRVKGGEAQVAADLRPSCRRFAVAHTVAPQAMALRILPAGDTLGAGACSAIAAYRAAVGTSVKRDTLNSVLRRIW